MALTITTTWLPQCFIGAPYSAALAASGARGNPTWSVNGLLPFGLSLNPGSGVISGTVPAESASGLRGAASRFIFSVSDGASSASTALTLDILDGTRLNIGGQLFMQPAAGPAVQIP